MNKKNIIILLIIILVIVGFVYFAKKSSLRAKFPYKQKNIQEETIQIGAILPLSGPGGEFADYIKKGLELGIKEVQDSSDMKIKIHIEDSKTSPKEGVNALNKIISTQNNLINITALSSVARATMPIILKNNKIALQTAVAVPGVTDGKNLFRICPEAKGMSGVMAKYTLEKLGLKKAVVIYINDDFGKSSLDAYTKTFESLGGEVVYSETYEMKQSDFKNQIAKIKNLSGSFDVIYVNGYGPAYSNIIKQIKTSRVDAVITSDMTMGVPSTQKNVGKLSEGIYFVEGGMSQKFKDKYFQEYGSMPTSYAGYAYDIIHMINKVGSVNSAEEFSKKIKNIKYHGAMGDIHIRDDGESELEFNVYKIVDGVVTKQNK